MPSPMLFHRSGSRMMRQTEMFRSSSRSWLQNIVSWPLIRMFRSSRWLSIIVPVVLLWVAYLALFSSRLSNALPGNTSTEFFSRAVLESLGPPTRHSKTSSRRLHLFMPADSPHLNLCKTIMSAVAMGYPSPILLNWNREYNRPTWQFAGSHIAKLEGFLGGIESLLETDPDASEDDVAVLVDAYDVWFQLPPSVLLERFHQLNREADARVRKQWQGGSTDFPIPPPKQNIIVTTAKDCFPDSYSGSDPHYEHWPKSPIPTDLYGPDTDTVPWSFDPARKYRKVRPRCVNSGLIMGKMGALRDTLHRCREKIDRAVMSGRQLWSDQALIGEVIGDQEIWREWIRGLGSSWNGSFALNDRSNLQPEVRTIADAALQGRHFEFGIGLDYNFTTIPPTCSAEEDGNFVQLSDADAVRAESTKAGVAGNVRVHGIPPELRNLSDKLLAGVDWASAPLYTDFYFGNTPVGIHHNAYVDGLKPWRLEHWWGRMWYYPQLRTLITERLNETGESTLLARITEEDVVYLASELKGVRVLDPLGPREKFTSIEWGRVCQKRNQEKKWYDELFGDGKGPLDGT